MAFLPFPRTTLTRPKTDERTVFAASVRVGIYTGKDAELAYWVVQAWKIEALIASFVS